MTSSSPLHILVIEDNPDLAANVCDFLEAKGHAVDVAGDGLTGLHLAVTQNYDAIVLDIVLPGMDGLTLCRKFREEAMRTTPVLMLTARDALDDRVAGLECGADDYVLKPFALRELEARLKALVRRASSAVTPSVLRVGDLEYDPALIRVRRGTRTITLPPIPLKLLETLMRAAPRVVRREELERAVWGDAPPDSDALRAHLHVVRAAIDGAGEPPLIHTLRGVGYRMMAPDAL
ncbi:response regulator transcription factor [Thiobacillus sp. 65-1402]|uniref:response regulator transcription factor n=1 Tax=Thiobacillus sp. 65-1402 TaxID=1895861 RepID=UPI00095BC46E|nr:response regulator transcription factor [Thiobacillus sp. 65-1402]OJW99656.1 MAG: DNA-binding response regulator [Thiobacillus sp. 65-1402]